MNNKQRTQLDDEDDFVFPSGKVPLGFSVKSRSFNNFIVHINTDIKSPDHYSKVFDMLLDTGDDDLVDFFIASPGGRLDGLCVLLEGIRLSDAHTRAILIGEASSAASILALNCGEIVVTDSAEMLAHAVTYGTVGKAADISAHVEHTAKVTEKLLRSTYEGFMEPSEIELMLQGKQWYFDADQIRERLEKRAIYFEEKQEAEEKAAIAEVEPTQAPKKRTRKAQQ